MSTMASERIVRGGRGGGRVVRFLGGGVWDESGMERKGRGEGFI